MFGILVPDGLLAVSLQRLQHRTVILTVLEPADSQLSDAARPLLEAHGSFFVGGVLSAGPAL